jgi:hypothetical protein
MVRTTSSCSVEHHVDAVDLVRQHDRSDDDEHDDRAHRGDQLPGGQRDDHRRHQDRDDVDHGQPAQYLAKPALGTQPPDDDHDRTQQQTEGEQRNDKRLPLCRAGELVIEVAPPRTFRRASPTATTDIVR